MLWPMKMLFIWWGRVMFWGEREEKGFHLWLKSLKSQEGSS